MVNVVGSTLFLPVMLWLFTQMPTDVEGVGCGRCLNGGRAYLPNSVFGTCKCRCKPPFKGPACQFTKRSGSPISDLHETESIHDNIDARVPVPKLPEDMNVLPNLSDADKSNTEKSSVLAGILKDLTHHLKATDYEEEGDQNGDRYQQRRAKIIRDWMYSQR